MREVFLGAEARVQAVSPRQRGDLAVWRSLTPATTLCVAAWTPQHGLLVGSMGDTLTFDVEWDYRGSTVRRVVAGPHRERWRPGVRSYLRAGLSEAWILGDADKEGEDWSYPRLRQWGTSHFANTSAPLGGDFTAARVVVVASDGAWEALEPIARLCEGDVGCGPVALPDGWPYPPPDRLEEDDPPRYSTAAKMPRCLAGAVDLIAGSPELGAEAIAERLLDAGRRLGLTDNATVAVAAMPTYPRWQPPDEDWWTPPEMRRSRFWGRR